MGPEPTVQLDDIPYLTVVNCYKRPEKKEKYSVTQLQVRKFVRRQNSNEREGDSFSIIDFFR